MNKTPMPAKQFVWQQNERNGMSESIDLKTVSMKDLIKMHVEMVRAGLNMPWEIWRAAYGEASDRILTEQIRRHNEAARGAETMAARKAKRLAAGGEWVDK